MILGKTFETPLANSILNFMKKYLQNVGTHNKLIWSKKKKKVAIIYCHFSDNPRIYQQKDKTINFVTSIDWFLSNLMLVCE